MDAQRAAAKRMTALLRQLRDPETGKEGMTSSAAASSSSSSSSASASPTLTSLSLNLLSPVLTLLPPFFFFTNTLRQQTTTNVRSSHRGRPSRRVYCGSAGSRRRPRHAHARRLPHRQALRNPNPRGRGDSRDGPEANHGRRGWRGTQDLRPGVSGLVGELARERPRALLF